MTPLLLVSGFLGAGKTTFLRALVPTLAAHRLRPRVVLNDFQNARVDAATLRDLVPEMVALDGDCVCCETFADLLDVLSTMALAPADVIVVETNGTTDTGVLLERLGGEPSLGRLSPPMQLTVVDSQRFGTRGWQNTIEAEQIVTATHLFFSRTDVVDAHRRAAVAQAVAQQAPRALTVTAETLAAVVEQTATLVRGLADRAALVTNTLHADDHEHGHDQAAHSAHHFASLQLPLPVAVDTAAFLAFLTDLPTEIVRAKGIVALRDQDGERRSFQKVGDEVEISPCRLADPDEIEPVAVFVGVSIPVDQVRALLAPLLR